MIDFFNDLVQKWNLDIFILLIVICSGFFQEKFLEHWQLVKDGRLCAAIKTLIVSFGVSSIYIFITYQELRNGASESGAKVLIPWGKYFITFFTATSIYDFLIRPVRKWLSRDGNDKPNSPQQ